MDQINTATANQNEKQEYEFHELADMFPLNQGTELEALADDIKQNGLLDPIVLHEGKILDGRHRWLACFKAAVQPRFIQYVEVLDPLEYVLSKNLVRRQLSTFDKAELGSKLATMKQGRQPLNGTGTTLEEAAKKVGVSEKTIRDLKIVTESGDAQLIAKVRSGELSIKQGARQARALKKEAEFETEASAPSNEPETVANDNTSEKPDELLAWSELSKAEQDADFKVEIAQLRDMTAAWDGKRDVIKEMAILVGLVVHDPEAEAA